MLLPSISHEFLGTLPGWITAAGMATLAGKVLSYKLGIKKVEVDAEQVRVTAQTTSNSDIRDHYAQEVSRLVEVVKEATRENEDCRRERDELHMKVISLEEKLIGITRQFVTFQMETAKAIPPGEMTPNIREMLEKLQIIAMRGELS